jgi:hypothetical protein
MCGNCVSGGLREIRKWVRWVGKGWKGEEVPVEEGIDGKQSYLIFPGRPTTKARRRRREVFLGEARPAQTSREGSFLAGLTNAHSTPTGKLPHQAATRTPKIHRSAQAVLPRCCDQQEVISGVGVDLRVPRF